MTMRDYAVVVLNLEKAHSVCLDLSLFKDALADYISQYHQYVF